MCTFPGHRWIDVLQRLRESFDCLDCEGVFVCSVPQDGVVFGSADRGPALLPQQGGATSRDPRRGRQSVQPAHRAESSAGGKLKGTLRPDLILMTCFYQFINDKTIE